MSADAYHRCGDCGANWQGPEDVNGPCPSCGSPEGDWISCPDCGSCGVGGCCPYYCNRCRHNHDEVGDPDSEDRGRYVEGGAGVSRIAFTAYVAPLGTNHAYAPARWGNRSGFRKTDEARAYQAAIRAAALAAMGDRLPAAARCEVSLLFVFPANRGDIDGPIKLALDAMQGVVYANDRQVRPLHVDRATDKNRPRVEVEVVADDSQEAACAPRSAASLPSAAQPATPPPARPGTPAAALNVYEALFTGRRPARARNLAAQRRLKSSRKDYRP